MPDVLRAKRIFAILSDLKETFVKAKQESITRRHWRMLNLDDPGNRHQLKVLWERIFYREIAISLIDMILISNFKKMRDKDDEIRAIRRVLTESYGTSSMAAIRSKVKSGE